MQIFLDKHDQDLDDWFKFYLRDQYSEVSKAKLENYLLHTMLSAYSLVIRAMPDDLVPTIVDKGLWTYCFLNRKDMPWYGKAKWHLPDWL